MEQFLGYLPKLIVTVGLLYFAFNPIFRHQNTLGGSTLGFVAGVMVIAARYKTPESYEEPLWILLGWTLLFVATKIVLWVRKRDGYVLFHLFRKNAPNVESFLRTSTEAAGLTPDDWHFSQKWPLWVSFTTEHPKAVKKVVKELESFIQKHVPFSFWNAWSWMIVVLIMLASLWRF